ncbi:MAG TPA: serine hydrolase domain-containing protein [Gemmatimonadales bacterium]|nr:serine hydrolase domain-containing protein [Gemmatimonadales bacterium]
MSEHSVLSHRPTRAFTRASVTRNGGFSRPRLARMHAILERHVQSGQVPGLVALVHRRGHEHVEVIGTMGFERDVPMRRDTIFRLASTTKPITAAGAMVLVEECRIRLDDPVDQWLPELTERRVLRTIDGPLEDTVPAKRPITLRDLLTFRSGYGETFFLSPTCPLQNALSEARLSLAEWPFAGTPDEFMQRLGKLPLAHQPGERWLYHTSGEILGVLIARVAGKSLGTFLRERIFDPLGMTDTTFQLPEAKRDRLPPCYGRDMVTGELVLLQEAGGGYAARPSPFESGAGGLVSTVDDLLAFGEMMLPNGASGGERILSRPSIELMTMDHLTPEQKALSPFFPNFWGTRGWGLGLGVITARGDVAEVPGRFGWDGAFGTSWFVDPKEELVGVLMTQRRPDQLALPPVVLDFCTSVYQLIDD